MAQNHLLFVDRCSSLVERSDTNWQAIETRTNGTAASDVTSQTVWSASYINAAVLQDTYSDGVIQSSSRLYFEQDANYNLTTVVGYDSTTQTWDVVQRYVYSAYGNITILNADWSVTSSGTQPLVNNLYQGMTLDPVTGLYYERFRNYSPSLGVWTSQDPLQYINGANTYQFVMDNPVGKMDPKGLCAACDQAALDFGLMVVDYHLAVISGVAAADAATFAERYPELDPEAAVVAEGALLDTVVNITGTLASATDLIIAAEGCEKCNPCPSNVSSMNQKTNEAVETIKKADELDHKIMEFIDAIRDLLK